MGIQTDLKASTLFLEGKYPYGYKKKASPINLENSSATIFLFSLFSNSG